MEYQKAKLLNNQLEFWMNACVDIMETTQNGGTYRPIEELKLKFAETDLDTMYDDFIEELKANIREYRNIEYMDNYIEGAFIIIDGVNNYDENFDSDIVRNGYEVKFLLSVTRVLNQTIEKVNTIFYGKDGYTYSNKLKQIFYDEMVLLQPDFQRSDIKDGEEKDADKDDDKDVENPQFNFRYFKKELALLDDNKDKINLINNRLIDFEQWFIEKGEAYTQVYCGTKNHVHTEFFKLCMSEIKRYPVAKEPQPPKEAKPQEFKNQYSWTGSDTALLELITSLYHSDCIERRDGKTVSRKELIDYFQTILGTEIKDVEGKLTRATGRKINMTPFLDSLKIAFISYAEEKEEKQRKRK